MIIVKGKQEKQVIVVDTKTGATAITNESYGKKLQKQGVKKIVSMEGEKSFNKLKIK